MACYAVLYMPYVQVVPHSTPILFGRGGGGGYTGIVMWWFDFAIGRYQDILY